MKDDKTELFETMPIPKAFMKLAIPTVIGTLITILYNLTDTYFVGYLNNADQTASVTIAGNITLFFIAIENLFGIGGGSFLGRALGMGKREVAKNTSAFCIWGAIGASLLLALGYSIFAEPILGVIGAAGNTMVITKEYLLYACTLGVIPSVLTVVLSFLIRTDGYAIPATIGVLSGAVLNIILDPFFILPRFANMGAAGAGCATLIGNTVACGYMIVYVLSRRKTTVVSLNPRYAKPSRLVAKEVFGVGIPATIQNMLNVTGTGVLNHFAAIYGAEAVAAIGVAYKLYMMPMYLATAMGQGAIPLVSYNYGSRNYLRVKKTVVFTLKVTLLITIVLGLGEFFFSELLVRSFIDVERTWRLGGLYLKCLCVGVPALAVDFFGVGIYQAIGEGKISLFFAIARKIILEIPAMFLFVHLIGENGLGLAQPVTEIILAVVTVSLLWRFGKKWTTAVEESDEGVKV